MMLVYRYILPFGYLQVNHNPLLLISFRIPDADNNRKNEVFDAYHLLNRVLACLGCIHLHRYPALHQRNQLGQLNNNANLPLFHSRQPPRKLSPPCHQWAAQHPQACFLYFPHIAPWPPPIVNGIVYAVWLSSTWEEAIWCEMKINGCQNGLCSTVALAV